LKTKQHNIIFTTLFGKFFLILILLVPTGLTLHSQQGDAVFLGNELNARDSLQIVGLIASARENFLEGMMENAYDSALKALQRSKVFNYRPGKAEAYRLMAEIRKSQNRGQEALRNYFSALREYEWQNEPLIMAGINREIGDAYRNAGLPLKASQYYEVADSLNTMAGQRDYSLQEDIADVFMADERYISALSYLDILTSYYRGTGEGLKELDILSKVIRCKHETGDFEGALESLERSLEIYRQQNDPEGIFIALNNLGINYKYLGDHQNASEFLELAIENREGAKPAQYVSTLVNLSIVYQNLGEEGPSLELLEDALKLARDEKLKGAEARIEFLLSKHYLSRGDYYNALVYSDAAIRDAEVSGRDELLADLYLNSSEINTALYDYEKALEDYQRYLTIRDSVYFSTELEKQKYLQQEFESERLEREIGLLVADEALKESMTRELVLDTIKKRQQIELQQKTIANQELERIQLEQEKLLAEERLAAEIRDREILELKVIQQEQEDSLKQVEFQRRIAQAQAKQANLENERLTVENQLQEESLRRVRSRNYFLIGISILVLIILLIVYRSLRYARNTNRLLRDQRNKIEQQRDAIQDQYEIIERERAKSDKLLLNILPEETADELKETGKATPRSYEMVSVLFTDFKGFTQVAEKLSAEEIVLELDICFMEFDKIADRHNLEKIKTIGDAYMCAGGIPVENTTNAVDVVEAAIEIRDFMEKTSKERAAKGQAYWQLRIGINTGHVVAGVVGKNKFAYDIWGDAVNVASRMESSGEPGKINISGETYELVRDKFACTYRGKVMAKNKGEVDMYFVEGRK
jgi:class 3 adenylate cyclase/tetratricopeptide (TPR) repeat protein